MYAQVVADKGRNRNQRWQLEAASEMGQPLPPQALSAELKAAIILFFSLLDEKQQRLYAGLESHKLGHGGDRKIAELLGVDMHTVSRGRQELLVRQVLSEGCQRHPKTVAKPSAVETIRLSGSCQ